MTKRFCQCCALQPATTTKFQYEYCASCARHDINVPQRDDAVGLCQSYYYGHKPAGWQPKASWEA